MLRGISNMLTVILSMLGSGIISVLTVYIGGKIIAKNSVNHALDEGIYRLQEFAQSTEGIQFLAGVGGAVGAGFVQNIKTILPGANPGKPMKIFGVDVPQQVLQALLGQFIPQLNNTTVSQEGW